MKYLAFLLLVFSISVLSAQSASLVSLSFVPTYHNTPVLIAEEANFTEDSIEIEVLKFYISQVELYQGEQLVFAEANSFHLLDASDTSSLRLSLDVPDQVTFSQVRFNLGIDSLTHVAGVLGGDLDPMHGMYWTWQSGYIHFKLEGLSDNCPSRNHRFQFHLGGYQRPFNTLQKINLPTNESKDIKISVAIDQLLSQVDLATTHHIMSPNEQAMHLAQLLASTFSISK